MTAEERALHEQVVTARHTMERAERRMTRCWHDAEGYQVCNPGYSLEKYEQLLAVYRKAAAAANTAQHAYFDALQAWMKRGLA